MVMHSFPQGGKIIQNLIVFILVTKVDIMSGLCGFR
jgi:hypothetical protein